MTFGERLALCIEKAGLNQKQLAEIMDVTPTRLHYWVRDKREPDISHIRELSNALGVTADYLIGNVDENMPSEAAMLKCWKNLKPCTAAKLRRFLIVQRMQIPVKALYQRAIRRPRRCRQVPIHRFHAPRYKLPDLRPVRQVNVFHHVALPGAPAMLHLIPAHFSTPSLCVLSYCQRRDIAI